MRSLVALLLLLSLRAVAADPVVIYLAGDSTMAEKTAEARPETGWGEKLSKYFDDSAVHIENHAKNGRSTRSFLAEGRWNTIVRQLRAGDYVFIQFGHNDAAVDRKNVYTSPDEYRLNLEKFIAEVRAAKATPVLLTPVMRRRFDARGEVQDTHGAYPDIVRKLAADRAVALLDMHRDSGRILREYGAEDSKKLFLILPAGASPNYARGVEDNTHFSPLGAEEMAAVAVDEIRELLPELGRHLKDKPARTSQLIRDSLQMHFDAN